MGQVRAIVFDSSAFGKGALPNVETIQNWVQACAEHSAELWIPKVVALELAQHVVEECAKLDEQIRAYSRNRKSWGLPPTTAPSSVTVDDVLEVLEGAGAVLVELDGDDAIEAIVDQVLLRGVGERKSGVKTGAADSAWVRSIISTNGGDSEGLLVITGDERALIATCEELGVQVPRHVRHLGLLHALLGEGGVITSELRAKFDAFRAGGIDGPYGLAAEIRDFADLGPRNWWDSQRGRDFHVEWELQELTASPDGDSELLDGPVYDAWSNSLTAEILLRFLAEEQYSRQDRWGDHAEYLAVRYPAALRATFTVFIDDDGGLRGLSSLDEVQLVDPSPDDVDEYPI